MQPDPFEELRRDNERRRGPKHNAGNGKDHASDAADREFTFKLTPIDKIELDTDCPYLIRDIIPSEGLTVVWGPPKCGKSFWLYDALMHVAMDWEYRGHAVIQGPIVYVACEGEKGVRRRSFAYREFKLNSHDGPVPFHLVTTKLNLREQHPTLISDIRAQIGDITPAAIAIDTLNKSLVGSENKDEDMSAYVQAADAVREAFKCAVCVVHHCGVEGTRPRGHTSLAGAADAQIAVKRDEAGIILTTVEFLKDGDEGETIASKLEVVVIGKDKTGADITSCLVLDTEAPAPKAKGKKPLPGDYARAREFLADAIVKSGITVNLDGIPSAARVITMDAWKATLADHGLIGKANGARDGAQARDWLHKMKRRLIGDNMIREAHSYVWLTKQ
jgi:hypothetical protein